MGLVARLELCRKPSSIEVNIIFRVYSNDDSQLDRVPFPQVYEERKLDEQFIRQIHLRISIRSPRSGQCDEICRCTASHFESLSLDERFLPDVAERPLLSRGAPWKILC